MAVSLLATYLVVLLLVNFTSAQRWLANVAENALTDKLGTRVSIDRLEIGLFNRVVLHGVTILDRQGETLLAAKQMSAKIEYRALLDSRVSLRTVSLLDADINFYRERPDSATNFAFVIEAFSSKEKKQPSRLNLSLGSVIIRRVHFRYNERYSVRQPHRFSPSHLDVTDFNASISLRQLTNDSLNLRVRSLSLKEASGLDVHQLSFRLAANRCHCAITDFSFQLHGSRFDEDRLEASYDLDRKKPFLSTLNVSGRVNHARLSLDDIACFVPRLRSFPYTVELSSVFSVNPRAISISSLSLRELDDKVQLAAHAQLLQRNGEIYRASGSIDKLEIADGAAATILSPMLSTETQAMLNRLGNVKFTATGHAERGERSQLNVEAQTACGQVYASLHWLDVSKNGVSSNSNGITTNNKHTGDVRTINAQLSTKEFDLSTFLANDALPTNITLQADAEARLRGQSLTDFSTTAIVERINYKGNTYRDIHLTASRTGSMLSGEVHSNDPVLSLNGTAQATVRDKSVSAVLADLHFNQLTPATLGLGNGYLSAATYSGHLKADIPLLTWRSKQGTVSVSDFSKRNAINGNPVYHLNNLTLTFSPSQQTNFSSSSHPQGHLHLSSDFAVADFDGELSVENLKRTIESRLRRVLPALFSNHSGIATYNSGINSHGSSRPASISPNNTTFNARLTKSDVLRDLLGIPIDFSNDVLIEGTIAANGHTSLLTSASSLSYNGVAFQNLHLYVRGNDDNLSALLQGTKNFNNTLMKFALTSKAEDDAVDSELQWDDADAHHYFGSVSTLTTLSHTPQGQLSVSSDIRPTNIIIGDTLWTLGAGNVTSTGRNLSVNHVSLSHNRVGQSPQSLSIRGQLTRQPSDSLRVELRDIDISYILSLANVKPVSFGGQATGTLVAKQTNNNPSNSNSVSVSGLLHVPHFSFNDGDMGDADIKTTFTTHNMRISMDAAVEEAGVGYTNIRGYVGIGEKGLDLDISGRNTTLYFLRRYLPAMFQDISGRTTGHCRLYGAFKALNIEGDEQVSFYAKMSPLGCGFHLSDGTLTMRSGTDDAPSSFVFRNFKMQGETSENGDALAAESHKANTGTLNGTMLHDHFKNFRYDFTANVSDMLLYDKGRAGDMPFYATAYATGGVHLYGKPGSFTADINARPTRGTTMTYIVDTHSSSVDVSLLTFGTKNVVSEVESDTITADGQLAPHNPKLITNNSRTTDITLNFIVDMQPEADVRVVMDEKTGNNITLAGTGALRATYYNKGTFQMFGNFIVDHGLYKMTIQDVIQKNLHFESGGNIVFAGNPFDGELDLKAVYTVPSVSLTDLGLNLSGQSVRADCILHMGGKVLSPQITFGLNLPDASEEVKQMVHQYVTTDEDMNRQVLHLLGLGRFYNYNFAATDAALGGQSQTSVAMKSLLASTLTSQLNNIITNAIGTSDWTFGANLTTGQIGWSDMEVAGMLSGKLLGGRLLVNGNLGYRDHSVSNTNFVGDFDISYLLTPAGGIRLRAYSETNDRYFSKTALTTQGIGIQFRRDFNKFTDIFSPRTRRKTAGIRP